MVAKALLVPRKPVWSLAMSEPGCRRRKVRGVAVVGVELDREPVLDTADRQAAAGGSDGVGATGIVMEHDGRPVGAAVAGAEIDLEGDGEVLAHIDAPRRHRRAGLVRLPSSG